MPLALQVILLTLIQILNSNTSLNFIVENGRLYTWGFNFYEQLGLGGDSERDFEVPTRVQKNISSHKVKWVSCGYFHTGALICNNEIA